MLVNGKHLMEHLFTRMRNAHPFRFLFWDSKLQAIQFFSLFEVPCQRQYIFFFGKITSNRVVRSSVGAYAIHPPFWGSFP